MVGERCANAWGTRAWQQARALEADAEAISRMCSYALCLVAEVGKRLGPKKPFLQTHSARQTAVEDEVNGGLAFG